MIDLSRAKKQNKTRMREMTKNGVRWRNVSPLIREKIFQWGIKENEIYFRSAKERTSN